MAVGEYLPPVVTRLSMDIEDFLAKIETAKAALKTLADTKVDVEVDTKGVATAVTAMEGFKNQTAEATFAQAAFAGSVRDTNGALYSQAMALMAANDGLSSMSRRATTTINRQRSLKSAIQDTSGAMQRQAMYAAAMGIADAGGGGAADAGAARAAGGARLFGLALNANTLHWIISGGAEILAVTVPALIALGSAALVAAEGYQNIQQHMTSVSTTASATSQMFGQSTGQILGLGNALQQAQDAAAPGVYGVLGSAMLVVKEQSGGLIQAGSKLDGIFQTFAAHVVADFAPGGAMASSTSGLMSNMVSDAVKLGQVFGNIGHIIAALANQMPGIAEVLLGALAGVTRVISAFIQFGSVINIAGFSLITLVMGYEEFNRWGRVVVSLLGRMGIAMNMTDPKGKVLSWSNFGNVLRSLASIIPTLIGHLGSLVTKLGASGAGGAISNLADSIGMGISTLSTWQLALVGAAAVGLGFLIYKLATAKDSVQQLTDALQQNVEKSTNAGAFQTIDNNFSQLTRSLAQVNQQAKVFPFRNGPMLGAIQTTQDINTLNSAFKQQTTDMVNVANGAQWISKTFGVTVPQALAIADLANVKLANGILGTGKTLSTAQLQIKSLVTGYQAMGQPLGVIGNDVSALNIAAGLQASQVNKLNQAWDSYMGTLTGGTSALATFSQDLTSLTSGTNTTTTLLGKGSVTLSVKQFASDLKTFTGNGAQAWQNFSQVIGSSAPQLIDWLRTMGAAGEVSAPQFKGAVEGMISALIPFVSQSKTAQSLVTGLANNIGMGNMTFNQLAAAVKKSGNTLNTTDGVVEQATQKFANLNQVAVNLGNTLNNAVQSAMANAIQNTSGLDNATTNLVNAFNAAHGKITGNVNSMAQQYAVSLHNMGINNSTIVTDLAALASHFGMNAQAAMAWAQQTVNAAHIAQSAINSVQGKTVYLNTVLTTSGAATQAAQQAWLHPKAHNAIGTTGFMGGWSWVGENGPELVNLPSGSSVMPNYQAASYGSPAMAGGDGGETHVHVYLDGREIYNSVQRRAVTQQRRSGTNGLSKRTR